MGGAWDTSQGWLGGLRRVSGTCQGQILPAAKAQAGPGSQNQPLTRPEAAAPFLGVARWMTARGRGRGALPQGSGCRATYFPNNSRCGQHRPAQARQGGQPGSARRGLRRPPDAGTTQACPLPTQGKGTEVQHVHPTDLPGASAPGQECGEGEGQPTDGRTDGRTDRWMESCRQALSTPTIERDSRPACT